MILGLQIVGNGFRYWSKVFPQIVVIRAKSQAIPLRSKKAKNQETYSKNFVDTKEIEVTAGDGGNGCMSLASIYKNEFAGPDGGDGGSGGHVIFQAHASIYGLEHVNTKLKAPNGEKGYNKDCNGKNGEHLIVHVPTGTIVKNHQGRIVADLAEENIMFIAARGGAGGRGNHFFSSATEPTPRIAEYGGKGEVFRYLLELSSIAHFGLLGFPNAGKSTLLQSVTRANPKVASYPFTTLKPHLGVVRYSDLEQITIADLPGLIEGSHRNKGLGISFLRHAERCMGLLILLDMSRKDAAECLYVLHNEVLSFSQNLIKRPQVIVANKMDEPGAEENLIDFRRSYQEKHPIFPISAKHGQNLTQLLSYLKKIYDIRMAKRKEKDKSRAKFMDASAVFNNNNNFSPGKRNALMQT